MTNPAGMPSTYASLPQEPHSSRVCETQASFSSPGSPAAQARSAATGIELPVDALPARAGQILQRVQGQIDQTSRHTAIPISNR